MLLDRRQLSLTVLATLLAAPAWAAEPKVSTLTEEDQALVDQAGAYLQDLTEAKGRFVQTDARGNVTQGDLFLKRPGRARFAYDAPSSLLVVADGANVTIANSQLKTFERYPLMATPLSIFLARQIRLDRRVIISSVSHTSEGFSLTARDGRHEAEGRITLRFSENPVTLIGWTVTDAQGQSVRISLSGMSRASGLPASLFLLKDPRPRAPGRARM
jgi:outer membrane lipoprotein-sorting protein